MSEKYQHAKNLDRVAKSILAPLGMRQKGRSRTWLDDHSYWLIVVEFQPSSWSRGSYLNVGCMWLFYPKDYISFDYGYREQSFIQYSNDEQFEAAAVQLSSAAFEKVLEYRERFRSLLAIQSNLVSVVQSANPWSLYHAAVVSGLVGSNDVASRYFRELMRGNAETDWQRTLQVHASACLEALSDRMAFNELIRSFTNHTRQALRLDPVLC